MELLDIQIDLFHFKGLLDSIGTENQENTHEQLSGRLLYYIANNHKDVYKMKTSSK